MIKKKPVTRSSIQTSLKGSRASLPTVVASIPITTGLTVSRKKRGAVMGLLSTAISTKSKRGKPKMQRRKSPTSTPLDARQCFSRTLNDEDSCSFPPSRQGLDELERLDVVALALLAKQHIYQLRKALQKQWLSEWHRQLTAAQQDVEAILTLVDR